jgi:DNA-binding NarL/FixJ family response regulator
MIRLLLVDDHPVVRAGYQRLLELDGAARVVAQAGCVDEGWLQFRKHAPDVTITDLSMPGSGGLELLRRIRGVRADARVVVFSMHCSEMLVGRAFELGATGFVSKNCPPDRLVEAVHFVMQGRQYLSPGLSQPSDQMRLRNESDSLSSLSHREFEIFRLIARGQSVSECAAALHLSPKTVSNLQSLIKEKLGVGTSAALVHLALRHGVIASDTC